MPVSPPPPPTALPPPTANFADLDLVIRNINPRLLIRVSEYRTGEPYFGRAKVHRFDDANPDEGKRFGTCYLGLSLIVAFTESVLHNEIAENNGFLVDGDQVTKPFAHQFIGTTLRLADMTGRSLFLLSGNGELTGSSDYAVPRQWAKAVYDNKALVDGFIYTSRQINDCAVLLFERNPEKPLDLKLVRPLTPLRNHADFAQLGVCAAEGLRAIFERFQGSFTPY